MDNIEVNTLTSMIGSTFANVFYDTETEELIFERADRTQVIFYHNQDCCESVYIEDICGELNDLIGYPILVAEERVSDSIYTGEDESVTYTFYEFRTIKGSVTVRWCGSSNGYYSESVDMFDSNIEISAYYKPYNARI